MTVAVDGSPKRLLDQSGRAVPALPAAFRPHGGAEIDARRAMVETVMHERLEAEFTRFIGVAPYDREAGRGGVRDVTPNSDPTILSVVGLVV
jgi:hypothetical protein